MRYLTCFLAAMFFASNAAATARACIAQLAGQEHAALRAHDAEGDAHLSPQPDDATACLTHCTLNYKSDKQQFSADVPLLVLAPAAAVFHTLVQAKPRLVIVALAPHIIGPPLTILYRNFRN